MRHSDESKRALLFSALYYSVLFFLLFFLLRYLLDWFLPAILGAGIAILLRPYILRLAAHTALGEKAAAAVCLLAFYSLLLVAVSLFFVLLFGQIYELMLLFPGIWTNSVGPLLESGIEGLYSIDTNLLPNMQQVAQSVILAAERFIMELCAKLLTWIASIAAGLPSLLLTGVFTAVISVLASMSYQSIGGYIRSLLSPKMSAGISEFQVFMRKTVWSMVRAYAILVTLTFLKLAAGLYLLGFDYAVSIAAIIALLDLLPFVGTGIVLIPWAVIQISSGNIASGAGLLFLFAIVEVVQTILEPRLISMQIGLHPIATITAMYAGLHIAGFMGMVFTPLLVLIAHKMVLEPYRTANTGRGQALL